MSANPNNEEYKPRGKIGEKIPTTDLTVYMHDHRKGDSALILIYDIYGMQESNKLYEICDRFHDAGCATIMPDFFRRDAWAMSENPEQDQKTKTLFEAWNESVASEKALRKDMFEIVLPWVYHTLEKKCVAICGVGWGARQAFNFASDELHFQCVIALHPNEIEKELADKANCPVFYLADEIHFEKAQGILKKKKKCQIVESKQSSHFFSAHGDDWTHGETQKVLDELFKRMSKFLDTHNKPK